MATNQSNTQASLFLIILSFAVIYIVWGGVYLFVAFAVEEIPPFKMAGSRFLVAMALSLIIVGLSRQYRSSSWLEIKNALIAGVLFLGMGTGGVAWALQYLDSGFVALFLSIEPLIIVFMMWFFNGSRPAKRAFFGVFLGIVGVYLLVGQKTIISGDQDWRGILAVIISMFCWGYATIFVNKSDLPRPQMLSSGYQMLSGGIFLLLVSFITREPSVDWFSLSLKTWGSLGFLVIFGGIVVFTAFNYLLKNVSPDKVATSTYVNPIIAILLGWWLRDEIITLQSIIAAIVLLLGVFFINSSK